MPSVGFQTGSDVFVLVAVIVGGGIAEGVRECCVGVGDGGGRVYLAAHEDVAGSVAEGAGFAVGFGGFLFGHDWKDFSYSFPFFSFLFQVCNFFLVCSSLGCWIRLNWWKRGGGPKMVRFEWKVCLSRLWRRVFLINKCFVADLARVQVVCTDGG